MGTGSAPSNVVLVHGAFVDGSGWRKVYELLTQHGYHAAVVQNPTLSLQGDAAATRLIIDAQDGDLHATDAVFMADSQVPWGVDALAGPVTEPAWRSKPSWYLIATEDHMIPPPAQRAMAQRAGATTAEVAASHAVYMSQPAAVAALIQQARG
ncbi:MAG TPA: alpha/beta hydrolase [Streptosporangiaceae bacterium]|jgi:pimeloyl-ACP methyl ester carboxylesterase